MLLTDLAPTGSRPVTSTPRIRTARRSFSPASSSGCAERTAKVQALKFLASTEGSPIPCGQQSHHPTKAGLCDL